MDRPARVVRKWADGVLIAFEAFGRVYAGRVVGLHGVRWQGNESWDEQGEPIYHVQIDDGDATRPAKVVRANESEIVGFAPDGSIPGRELPMPKARP